MVEKTPNNKKNKQLSLQEYAKVKEKLAQARLKIKFPLTIKLMCAVPFAIFVFLVLYYVLQVRFFAEH